MKKKINLNDYAGLILKKLKTGVLITAKNGDKINPMSIAWGQIGIEWNKPIFTTFVRTGRYTHQMLEKSGEFTVNIPVEDKATDIIRYCGTKSGRDVDKVKELGLTLVESDEVGAPGIKELPLTLECRIIYTQLQDKHAFSADVRERFYPDSFGSEEPSSNRDIHTMFYGEILKAYIIE